MHILILDLKTDKSPIWCLKLVLLERHGRQNNVTSMHLLTAQQAARNLRVQNMQFLPEDEDRGTADPLRGMGRDHPGGGGEDGGECRHQHLQTQTCVL